MGQPFCKGSELSSATAALPCITDGLPVGGPQFIRGTKDKESYWQTHYRLEQKPFEPHWNEALKLLRAKHFKTQGDFAGYFKKQPKWATAFKELVIRQHEMTLDTWNECFSRGKRAVAIPEAPEVASSWDALTLEALRPLLKKKKEASNHAVSQLQNRTRRY